MDGIHTISRRMDNKTENKQDPQVSNLESLFGHKGYNHWQHLVFNLEFSQILLF
jgi:hypothetical protein